ncbi:hypothetical protein N7470_007587 [Penicillium chermesinum]|nr:hypothetical protein N7470_007587 [Penicillium chermesinum]
MEVPHYLRGLRPRSTYVCNACRLFSSSPISSSGHSKWSTIKHDKARNDRAKSKERQMIVIESAIARGQGLSVTGQALEAVTIEAMFPGSVAVVVECQTDQKARVLQDIRHLIKTCGGIITPHDFSV